MALLALSPVAFSRTDNDPPKREPCGHSVSTHRHGVADAKHTTDLTRLRHFRDCARTKHKAKVIQRRIEAVKEAKQEAAKSWCSPTPAPDGAGCWEIPAWCVERESGGSWTAQNPTSPARGPYQLLSHGEPWPVVTREQAMEHHRIAADLYASSGLSPWVAC